MALWLEIEAWDGVGAVDREWLKGPSMNKQPLFAAGICALAGGVAAAPAGNFLSFTPCATRVTAEFATPADAEAAACSIAPLPHGAKLAFTTRWDDTNPAHVQKCEMLNSIGLKATCFLTKSDDGFYRNEAKQILAGGNALGNHSTSHPFLMEASVSMMFREIMEQRMDEEAATDSPVVSFVMPFNWNSPIGPERPKLLVDMLLNGGLYITSDAPLEGIPADRWYAGRLFAANDRAPDPALFEKGLAGALASIEKDPSHPRVVFGIHSWCDAAGNDVQKAFLSKIANNPDWFYGNDNEYGAYRYNALNGSVKKLGTEGRTATFEVVAFDPAHTGSDIPLSLGFTAKPVSVTSGGAALAEDRGTFTLPIGRKSVAKIDRAKADGTFAEFPGFSFTLSPDEATGKIGYAFASGGRKVEGLRIVIVPAPCWSEGRLVTDAPKGSLGLGAKSADPDRNDGEALYCASADFTLDGEPVRLWTSVSVAASNSGQVIGTPKDSALVMGQFPIALFNEADWVAASAKVGEPLANLSSALNERWFSLADPRTTWFAAASHRPAWAGGNDTYNKACAPHQGKAGMRLVAFEFEAPEVRDATFAFNFPKEQQLAFYLNGEKFERPGPQTTIPVKKGWNRIILAWPLGTAGGCESVLVSLHPGDPFRPYRCRKCPVD